LFGPVPSRRFGRSLGVDLTPYKTCSFDCVFCQLGRTTRKAGKRAEWVPTDRVLDELAQWIREDGRADVVTLAGSGEPTLHLRFGDVIRFVHSKSQIPVVVLTNGSLLSDLDVRKDAAEADIVKVSLSAYDQASFEAINRPDPGLRFDALVEGERLFREEFRGKLWMEVFIVPGINSHVDQVRRIAEIASTIRPDRVQLNTAVRPPAESDVRPVARAMLEKLAALFDPPAEVIAEFASGLDEEVAINEETLFDMLTRRPCTLEQMAETFGMHRNEVAKYTGKLVRTGRIRAESRGNETYYVRLEPDERAEGEA